VGSLAENERGLPAGSVGESVTKCGSLFRGPIFVGLGEATQISRDGAGCLHAQDAGDARRGARSVCRSGDPLFDRAVSPPRTSLPHPAPRIAAVRTGRRPPVQLVRSGLDDDERAIRPQVGRRLSLPLSPVARRGA
jgi:hypothetical protein